MNLPLFSTSWKCLEAIGILRYINMWHYSDPAWSADHGWPDLPIPDISANFAALLIVMFVMVILWCDNSDDDSNRDYVEIVMKMMMTMVVVVALVMMIMV